MSKDRADLPRPGRSQDAPSEQDMQVARVDVHDVRSEGTHTEDGEQDEYNLNGLHADDDDEREKCSEKEVREWKAQKAVDKAGFTKTRRKLASLLDDVLEELGLDTDRDTSLSEDARNQIEAAAKKVDDAQERAMRTMSKLTYAYLDNGKLEDFDKISDEMEKIAQEYDDISKKLEEFISSSTSPSSRPVAAAVTTSSSRRVSSGSSSSQAVEFDPTRHLTRVTIPKFSGDKRNYSAWKAAFTSCVDETTITAEYKLLRLRECLTGEALKVVDGLGYSASAYEVAKDRLERKYGGQRRQLILRLDELEKFKQVRDGNAKDLEKLAELLDVITVNLKDAHQESELGSGSLFLSIQRKLSELLLARYHRWAYDKAKEKTVMSLREFVNEETEFQVNAMEAINGVRDFPKKDPRKDRSFVTSQSSTDRQSQSHSGAMGKYTRSCNVCGSEHGAWECDSFRAMSVDLRWKTAKEKKLCYRCLSGNGHRAEKCPRTHQCKIDGCKQTHHRLLHGKAKRAECRRPMEGSGNYQDSDESTMATVTLAAKNSSEIALRTVPVIIKHGGKRIKTNALLDDASTSTYIDANLAAELGVQGKIEQTTVNVLNGKLKTFTTMPVEVGIESLNRRVDMKIWAKTVDKVTGDLKATDWSLKQDQYSHLKDIQFPKIGKRTSVDLLIGADYSELHQSIRDVIGRPGEPTARETRLGWTCIGPVGTPSGQKREATNMAHSFFTKESPLLHEINDNLRAFWEIESISKVNEGQTPLNEIDRKVLQNARSSVKIVEDRYQVAVPWKGNHLPAMPDSREMAEKRLISTETKLQKNPELGKSYSRVIQQYQEKGYIKKIKDDERNSHQWYLPHFPVVRPDKSTTKTRIVFDASAKVDGVSLNDNINTGPKIQNELFEVLLRFRRYPVAIVCDIAEMYLQISLEEEDKRYHRFLWRDLEDRTRDPETFEFQRLVFGINSSPFLAQLISQEHARAHQTQCPRAAEAILKSTYMDDTLDSVNDDEQGKKLYRELSALWKGAGMHARKWLSNSPEVLAIIPDEDRASEINLEEGYLPSVKALGVLWKAEEDAFCYRLTPPAADLKLTKRSLLRRIATIFDPLGLMSPYVIQGKIIMQDVWMCGVEWDEELPEEIEKKAWDWIVEITGLAQARIPRCLQLAEEMTSFQLHTFGDASKDAYGTVVYARSTYASGMVATRIVASKTKVAPLTSVSIPRLEMMAAVLGLQLSLSIVAALATNVKEVVFWSDSQNVLWWIKRPSRKLKPFVANRVGLIQQHTDPQQWRYVPTKENPADLPSRGVRAKDLAESSLWWDGPEFLQRDSSEWPERVVGQGDEVQDEMKNESSYLSLEEKNSLKQVMNLADTRLDPSRFSSWQRLTRVHAWVQRFIGNCQAAHTERKQGELEVEEVKATELLLIRQCQKEAFAEEYSALCHGRELPKSSQIAGLTKLDADFLLRSNSRLAYADNLSYEAKFPIILPRKHHVTQLLVRFYHERENHVAGTNKILSEMSAKYWIIRGREEIRDWEAKCAACERKKARVTSQLMAPLPRTRVSPPMRAFSVSSVDYAGPFLTKQGRGRVQTKRYLCLFTCHASRAVHLEMAYALDTNSFLNAFNRFTHRRGVPVEVTSDNGTNFVGANRELMELVTQLDQVRVTRDGAARGIKWRFNPPHGPHFGGIHESLVKSAKKAIYAVLQKADITDEELSTAFTGAEALLNSRPLSYQSADSKDAPPITPNHFLFGQCGGQFAPEEIDSSDFNPRRRWRRVQELLKEFWSRWLKEWLPLLRQRHKWRDVKKDLEVGDVVLVADPGSVRGDWPMGRVTEVFTGRDCHRRVVKVQVGEKTMIRPIVRLCPLQC
ncbi:uncharacterized protein LOC135491588 [Lineus longissimus]|uniref:uncharacterized protein LOC135491588 n=1 Tax=Lineus longissimus TaxID=88925 RepID=UPI00315C7F0B